jgi:hypothetical protein
MYWQLTPYSAALLVAAVISAVAAFAAWRRRDAAGGAPPALRMAAVAERRIWLPVAGMFVLLCILVWLDEILDLPHFLLGAPGTPIN